MLQVCTLWLLYKQHSIVNISIIFGFGKFSSSFKFFKHFIQTLEKQTQCINKLSEQIFKLVGINELVMRKSDFAYAKAKVTAADQCLCFGHIVQSLYFLSLLVSEIPKPGFLASSLK